VILKVRFITVPVGDSGPMTKPLPPDPRVLLLDADGNLFPSEAPAFVASAEVTNRFLASLGVRETYTPERLLATTTGKNFRTTAVDLAVAHGVTVGPSAEAGTGPVLTPGVLDDWVAEEKKVVSEYLGRVLEPDPEVLAALRRLAGRYLLAAVSSSALSRLEECFRATGLTVLIPADRRYSAEDSLPEPTSKPDPAIYRYAAERLGAPVQHCLAVEDSVPGVGSAAGAGIHTLGNLAFVPPAERAERRRALLTAGAAATVESWAELAARLLPG
jgi:HAD superfamily hydrolase (TIGR01509 family)